MKRLTRLLVDESFNSMEMKYKTKNKTIAINKLDQLEDIEEELGLSALKILERIKEKREK